MTLASVDDFLRKEYRKDYTCLEFTADVWMAHVGEDILAFLKAFHSPVGNKRDRILTMRKGIELANPADPCIVVMQRPGVIPHMGVFLRGRVLHLQQSGPEFQPLNVATRCFLKTKFFQCRL